MTTARSPLRKLRAQADNIAAMLKAAERGETIVGGNTLTFKREDKPTIKFCVAMDDKALIIEMAWVTIKDTSEAGLSEYIMRQMRDQREAAH